MGRTGWRIGALALLVYFASLTLVVMALVKFMVMLEVVPLLLVGALQYPAQVALHARRTEAVLDMERKRSDAILKMSELEDAEETGQEPYVVPLVLLRQVLGLDMVKLFSLSGDMRDNWSQDAVIGEGSYEHDQELLEEAVSKGELISVKGEGEVMCSYVPLRTVRRPMGALFVAGSGDFHATESEQRMLLSYATQTAYFLESRELAQKMKDEEAVRTNLARYLSPQIVDQVIEDKMQVNLGGDRKIVTALFSDIRKFTTISETMPPDRLVAILNDYFNEMANIIFYHQGSLDKYIGDALIAVYGSLIELENPVKNCIDSAIAMMKIMSKLNWKWSNRYDGFTMDVGIGINTGEVFVGNIGSVERMEFTVIGDAINVASRFSDLAAPGQILITEPAMKMVEGLFDLEELEPVQVKGKSDKLKVFEVVYT
jgi:class 3 adenylate cyclase